MLQAPLLLPHSARADSLKNKEQSLNIARVLSNAIFKVSVSMIFSVLTITIKIKTYTRESKFEKFIDATLYLLYKNQSDYVIKYVKIGNGELFFVLVCNGINWYRLYICKGDCRDQN